MLGEKAARVLSLHAAAGITGKLERPHHSPVALTLQQHQRAEEEGFCYRLERTFSIHAKLVIYNSHKNYPQKNK